MLWSRLFGRSSTAKAADRLYASVVAQARQPVFYRDAEVPDTLDGRFDMITLHMILVLRRMRGPALASLSQTLLDTFFKNMDGALREMGVGDLTVPKKVRAMAQAFYGRLEAYEKAFAEDGNDMLAVAVERNVFRSEASSASPAAQAIARYMRVQDSHLATLDNAQLTEGRVTFTEASMPSASGEPGSVAAP